MTKKRFVVFSLVFILILMLAACAKSPAEEPAPEPEPTETTTGKDEPEPQTSSEPGDFDVSGPKWNWINWDADGDGTEEEIEFEYEDLGDEAPSYIAVTLYKGGEEIEGMIDRAYGLNRIFAKEDADGPYLEIDYDMGDYYSHDAEGHCTLRLIDGELVIEEAAQ